MNYFILPFTILSSSLLLQLSFNLGSHAFRIVSTPHRAASKTTRLFGISEWRDIMFDNIPDNISSTTTGLDEQPAKSVCLLPFPYTQVLLQGETKQLRLYEERFVKLFDDVMEKHEGVVAMGLLASSGVIQTVPLAEVEAYNRMEGFGIFVTLRVVGRAKLRELLQQEPYMKAVCTEISDEFPSAGEEPDVMADTIENAMITLSALEHNLKELSSGSAEKQKLDDKFFNDDIEEEDDDEEISATGTRDDRRRRFQKAYRIALDTDSQGYVSSLTSDSNNTTKVVSRSPRELSAVSWAAFMTEVMSEQDANYRIQAMDETNVFERLKLASYMLREKRDYLQKQVENKRSRGG